MTSNRTVLLVFVGLIALAGCLGGAGDGGAGDGGAGDGGAGDGDAGDGGAGDDSSDGDAGDGATSADWCTTGQRMQFTDPQTGEQATWEVQGIVAVDGRQACKVVWETNQGETRQVEMYFTEDESYRKMVTYDADGNVLNEVRLSGDSSDVGDGDSASGDDGSTSDWCSAASTMQFANPQTGEQVSLEIEGLVEEDGRQLCKAVWETNQGDISRIEMYFTEDESYQKMVMYDADGNVLNEVQMGSG